MKIGLLITTLFAHLTITNAQEDEEEKFLMVLGGWGGWPSSSDVGLVSIDPDVLVPTCLQNLTNFPMPLYFACSTTLVTSSGRRVPHVCGGREPGAKDENNTWVYNDKCHRYDPDLDTWNEVESLSVPRHEAGCSFSSEYGMVISGGYNDLKSTEYTLDGDKFESLSEPMPVGKNEHCLVALEDGDLFVTGGATTAPPGKTFIYQMSSNEWVAVGDMPTPRYYLMCGLATDANGAQKVVAAGGCNDNLRSLDTVEIFSVEDREWRIGRKLPKTIYGATVVPYLQSFTIVGGYTYMEGYLDSVYFYEVDADSWTKLDVTLPRKVQTVAAMMVDRSIFPSCGPPGPEYLMVIGGAGRRTKVEVLSLDEEYQLPYCLAALNDTSFETSGAVGAYLSDGVPIVCLYESTCFKYQADSDTWNTAGNMAEARSWGAGYAYNNKMGLVIAGGFDDGFGGVAYVDGTKNGIKFEPMTPLPTTPQYSCLASVDDETLFLTGGSNYGEVYDQALLYSTSTGDWAPAAPMISARNSHSCGVVEGINRKEVIVVGGRIGQESQDTNTVDIYNLDDGTWRNALTTFPHTILDAASVQFNGTLLVVGGYVEEDSGYTNKIYEYLPLTESWRELPAKLSQAASQSVAYMVPASIFPECPPVQYLMTMGGEYRSDGASLLSSDVTLTSLDINIQIPHCLQNLSSLTKETMGSCSATLTDDKLPHMCGGISEDILGEDHSDECYRYDPAADAWDLSGTMAVSRHQAGCAYSSVHGLVISGGCSGDCVAAMSGSDTVERTLDGVNLENLPEMPSRMYRHCLVDLGDGDLFVTGALRDPSQTFIYHAADGEWDIVAEMPEAKERYWSGCGLVRRPNGRRDVVVAGGQMKFDASVSPNVDIYSVDDDAWSEGTSLTFGMYGGTVVQNKDSFLMIGGFGGLENLNYLDSVLEYDEELDQFKQIAALPQGGRCFVTAVLVDGDIFPDCD